MNEWMSTSDQKIFLGTIDTVVSFAASKFYIGIQAFGYF